MFRIEGFVDDKNLATVMRALAGVTLDLKVLPVTNVKVSKNGGLKPKEPGDLWELFWKTTGTNAQIRKAHMEMFLKERGANPNSAGYYLKKLIDLKLFKKIGSGKNTAYVKVSK